MDNSQTHPSRAAILRHPAAAVFIAAFLFRAFVVTRIALSPYAALDWGDMAFYHRWALRILDGTWSDGQAFYGLPGYPFLLAGIYRIAGVIPYMVGIVQSLVDAGTGALIFLLAREVFRDRWGAGAGLMAAAGWLLFEPAQALSSVLMPTAWAVLVFWFVVWRCADDGRSPRSLPAWAGFGALIGLATTGVATVLFALPLAFARAWVGSRTFRQGAIASATLVAGVVIGTSPCWVYNRFVAGEPVTLSAHGGINLYIGNNEIATGYPKIPPGMRAGQEGMLKDSVTMAERAAGRPLKRYEVSRYWSGKARDFIREHPWSWARLIAIKIKNFWNDFQYDDLSLVALFRDGGLLVPGLRFGWVAVFGLVGGVVLWRTNTGSRWVASAVLLHMASLMMVFVTERYRMAAVPGLLILGSGGLWSLGDWIRARACRRAGIYLGLLTVFSAFVFWPVRDQTLWALDLYNTGIRATEAGDLDSASAKLEKAWQFSPGNAEINFALGNLWLKRGDRYRAKVFYRAAIDLDLPHGGAFNNLGVMATEEKRWDLAAKFFEKSLAVEPDDAKTWYLLAKTRLELGDRDGANAALGQAQKLKPDIPEFRSLE